jgi:nicotinate-nucleotide adenylyltransferase
MSEIVKNIIDGFAGEDMVIEKKIGLYFGSFNPIHVGHLVIGNYVVQSTDLDEVWFVVSPHNPHKKKANLLADNHRLEMVRIAVEDNPKLKASDIEFGLPKPSYTTYTLQALKEKHPDYQFTLIMGEDNLNTLHKWKNYTYILETYDIIVYPRVSADPERNIKSDLASSARVQICDAPMMHISSSFIRNMIKDKKEVKYLLTEAVYTYLDRMNFYK